VENSVNNSRGKDLHEGSQKRCACWPEENWPRDQRRVKKRRGRRSKNEKEAKMGNRKKMAGGARSREEKTVDAVPV